MTDGDESELATASEVALLDPDSDEVAHQRSRWMLGAGKLAGGNVVSLGISSAIGILVARVLGPGDFGLYSLIASLVGIVTAVTTFNLPLHLITELKPPTESSGEEESHRFTYARVLRAAYILTVPTCAAAIIILLVGFGGTFRMAALIATAEIFLAPLAMARVVLQVRMRFGWVAAELLLERVLWAVGVVLVVVLDLPNALVWIMSVRIVALGIELLVLARLTGLPPWLWLTSGGGLREELQILRISAPVAAAGLAGIAYHRIDQPLMASLRGPVETGIYGAGTRLAEMSRIISSVVQAVSLPTLVRYAKEKDRARFARALSDSLVLMLIPGGLVLALFISTGEKIAGFVFGPAYAETGTIIAILAMAEIAVFVATAFASASLALQERRGLFYGTALGLVVNLALNLALIPRFGAVAAAWASVASYAAAAAFLVLWKPDVRRVSGPALGAAARAIIVTLVAGFLPSVFELRGLYVAAISLLTYAGLSFVLLPKESLLFVKLVPALLNRPGSDPDNPEATTGT